MHDIIYTELFSSGSSSKGLPPATMSLLSAALSGASILIRTGVNFLSSCAFSATVPPYPYKLKAQPLLPAVPIVEGDNVAVEGQEEASVATEEAKTPEEMLWVRFCIVATGCIAHQSDRVLSDVYGTAPQASQYWASTLAIPELMSQLTVSKSLGPEGGELVGALVDYICSCSALFSVASVDMSPIMKFCLPSNGLIGDNGGGDEVPVEGAGVVAWAGEVVLSTARDLQEQTMLPFLKMLMSEGKQRQKLTQQFPSLCGSLIAYFPVWGDRISEQYGSTVGN
jgi:hypothetical protein